MYEVINGKRTSLVERAPETGETPKAAGGLHWLYIVVPLAILLILIILILIRGIRVKHI
jgi:hypothetical protein